MKQISTVNKEFKQQNLLEKIKNQGSLYGKIEEVEVANLASTG